MSKTFLKRSIGVGVTVIVITSLIVCFGNAEKTGNSQNSSNTQNSKANSTSVNKNAKKDNIIIVYKANTKQNITKEQMDLAKNVIRKRLDSRALFEAYININYKNNNIAVTIPKDKYTEKLVSDIKETAKVKFKDPNGKIIIDSNDILSAQPVKLQEDTWVVVIKLSEKSVKKFADATARISKLKEKGKNYIGIYLDGQVLAEPSVSQKVETQEVVIESTILDSKSAKELSDIINFGPLPFELKVVVNTGKLNN